MTNEREEMLEKSATLYFGPWYRQVADVRGDPPGRLHRLRHLQPHVPARATTTTPRWSTGALNNDVTLWDVGVERTVEVSGPDADRLIDIDHVPRPHEVRGRQGKYMLVTAPDGGIVNDPVLLHVEREHVVDAARGLRRRSLRAGRARRTPAWTRRSRCPTCTRCRSRDRRPSRRSQKLVGDADLRPQVLLVRLVRDRGHPGRDQPDRLDRDPGVRGQPAGLQPRATSSGTPSWRPARSSTSVRSRRARRAGSRPASSTTARTSRSATRRST